MGSYFTFIIISSLLVSSSYSQVNKNNLKKKTISKETRENNELSYEIDSSVYKSYKLIHYADLPMQIKQVMKNSGCGEIGADPSPSNDYKTNYDQGYTIDLNDDNKPEYLFSCEAPSHGPGIGTIYSFINGNWKIIGERFQIYFEQDPEREIVVLKNKNEGYHDILKYQFSNSKVIYRFINGSYYDIYSVKEAIKNILWFAKTFSKGIKNCSFGISNSSRDEMEKKIQYYPC